MQTGKKKNHQSLIYSSSTYTGYYTSSNYEIFLKCKLSMQFRIYQLPNHEWDSSVYFYLQICVVLPFH